MRIFLLSAGVVLYVPFMTKEIFEKMLGELREVRLGVKRHPGVVLPEEVLTPAWRRGEELVYLLYGLDLPVPIEGWEITAEGVGAVLSFSRTPRRTHVPWEAVLVALGSDPRPPEPLPRPKLSLVK